MILCGVSVAFHGWCILQEFVFSDIVLKSLTMAAGVAEPKKSELVVHMSTGMCIRFRFAAQFQVT